MLLVLSETLVELLSVEQRPCAYGHRISYDCESEAMIIQLISEPLNVRQCKRDCGW